MSIGLLNVLLDDNFGAEYPFKNEDNNNSDDKHYNDSGATYTPKSNDVTILSPMKS